MKRRYLYLRRRTRKTLFRFFSVTGAAILVALAFIQSDVFAGLLKNVLERQLPQSWGIHGDFTGFRLNLIPPGISIKNPKVTFSKGNIAHLPPDSHIEAERIDLLFYPLQMFSGTLRVNETVVVNGQVDLTIDPSLFPKKKKSATPSQYNWSDLFRLGSDSVTFHNAQVNLALTKPEIKASFLAKLLTLGVETSSSEIGFHARTQVIDLRAEYPKGWKFPKEVRRLDLAINGNSQGVKVDQFLLDSEGLQSAIHGSLTGDIFSPEKLSYELVGHFESDFAKLASWAGHSASAQGRAVFDGKLEGLLPFSIRAIDANGAFQGKKIIYENYRLDEIEAEGKWSGSKREIQLTKANLSSAPMAREGQRPASGGNIQVGAFRYSFDGHESVTIPLVFRGVHPHWLAAGSPSGVFPLDFRVDGSTELEISRETADQRSKNRWKISADLDWNIPHFQYDNQRLNKVRKLRKLLSIKDLSLKGKIDVTSAGIYPQDLQVQMPHTKLVVGGGIGFKTGLALSASGDIDMRDLGELNEKAIRGIGSLEARVHGGPGELILDFFPKLKAAEYLGLSFGDVSGKITYNDQTDQMIFSGVAAEKNTTHYTCNGTIEVGQKDNLALDFDILNGDIHDLTTVFHGLVADLWWFPESLTGSLHGGLHVGGKTDTDKLLIDVQLKGRDWDHYGEKFREVEIQGGYHEGRYFISKGWSKKYQGTIQFDLAFDEKNELRWKLVTEKFSLLDLDHVAALDVPFRGDLKLISTGNREGTGTQSHSSLTLSGFTVRGKPYPSTNLTSDSKDGVVKVGGSMLGSQGNLAFEYHLNQTSKSFLEVGLNQLDFTPLLFLLKPSLVRDPALQGLISGMTRLEFKTGAIEFGHGKFRVDDFSLEKTGTQLELAKPIAANIDGGNWILKDWILHSERGDLGGIIRSENAKLSGEIAGLLDLGILEFLAPVIQKADGEAKLQLGVSGSVLAPQVAGSIEVRPSQIQTSLLETPIENFSATIAVRQNEFKIRGFNATLSGGSLTGSGSLTLYPHLSPKVDIQARLFKTKVRVFPFYYVTASGGMSLAGEKKPYQLDGNLVIEEGLIRESLFGQKLDARKTSRYLPSSTSSSEELQQSFFQLNIHAHAARGISIKNEIFDTEVKGDVRVVNTAEAPRVLGEVENVSGKIIFKNYDFDIKSAKVQFDNPSVLDPKFDLIAQSEVKNYRVNLYASGRMSDWKVDLTSNPSLARSEIVSLLALGVTSDDMQKLRTEDQSALQQGEAASLILHSLDFNRDVKDKTGFQLHVEEAIDTQSAKSAFRRQNEVETGAAAPKIVIRRQVVKDVDISVGSTVGVGTGSQKEVSAEVKVAPGVSVIGVWNTYEGIHSTEEQTSYGLDLKIQKRFK